MKTMKHLVAGAVFGLAVVLSGCGDDAADQAANSQTANSAETQSASGGSCTAEQFSQKATALGNKISELAASDPQKAMDLTTRWNQVGQEMAANGDGSYDKACAAMDDMLNNS